MKILHTADWHIGKVLHKHDLQDDHVLFFDWLIDFINKNDIDLLLVSGDVFEMSNPASKDRSTYYRILSRLIATQTRVIITGGNHDSVAMLNAPRQILDSLNITVVGGADTENPDQEIIELKDDKGELECVVLAVPYLRDKDLRKSVEGESYSDRTEATRKGIAAHYEKLCGICAKRYDTNVPLIAMGHLYMQNSMLSESEREIQVGNQAGLDVAFVPPTIDYLALGHIHKPQVMEGRESVRYSGSPIPLSFSEREDNKQVVLLELENNKVSKITSVELPKNRELRKISGTLEQVKTKLDKYRPEFPLESFVEVEVLEEKHDVLKIAELQHLGKEEWKGKFKILKQVIRFQDAELSTGSLFDQSNSIEELNPKEVFQKRLEVEEVNKEDQQLLMEAFGDIYQMVLEKPNED